MLYPLSYIDGALDGNRTRDLRIQIRRSTSELQMQFPDAGATGTRNCRATRARRDKSSTRWCAARKLPGAAIY